MFHPQKTVAAAAAEARRAIKRLARPAGDFDAGRYFRGEHNLGQLARQAWGEQVALVGQGTHAGTVAAAHDWDGDLEVMPVRPSRSDSYERLCHDPGEPTAVDHQPSSTCGPTGVAVPAGPDRDLELVGVDVRLPLPSCERGLNSNVLAKRPSQ